MYIQYQFLYLILTRQTSAEKLNQLTAYHHLSVILRWALPIELQYYDFPIAVVLRKNNRNIGLAKLSDFKYWTSKTELLILQQLSDQLKPIGQKRVIFILFFFVFVYEFCRSDEFFANICKNSRVVGISRNCFWHLYSSWRRCCCCVIAVAGTPAYECVPDVASISAAAGVPLVPDVLTVAGFPAFVSVPDSQKNIGCPPLVLFSLRYMNHKPYPMQQYHFHSNLL